MPKSKHTKKFGSGNAWERNKNVRKSLKIESEKKSVDNKKTTEIKINDLLSEYQSKNEQKKPQTKIQKLTKSIKSFFRKGDR